MDNNNKKKQINPWRAFGLVGVIGIELAALLLIGIWVGMQIDQALQTSPLFLIVGMLLGFMIGIWSVVKLIKPFIGD